MSVRHPHRFPPDVFRTIGEVNADVGLSVSEWAEQPLANTAGVWTVRFIEERTLDNFLDALEADRGREAIDDELHCEQLVLTRAGVDPDELFDRLTWFETYPIDAARFTVADSALAPELATDAGFDRYLDGAHGLIADGRGVHVHLGGDGRGVVFTAGSAQQVDMVHVDLL